MTKALILVDFINEVVHPKGKLAPMGFSDFMERRKVFDNLNCLISSARMANAPVILVKLGFSKGHPEVSASSPVFSMAKQYDALVLGTWATEFHEKLNLEPTDKVLVKHRVSAFYSTDLEKLLKASKVDTVVIAGVATDLAVQSAVRDAHDRDFSVIVAEDCCAAANDQMHQGSIESLRMIAKISPQKDITFD